MPRRSSLLFLLPFLLRAQSNPSPANQTVTVTGSYEPVPLGESDRALHSIPVTPSTLLLTHSLADLLKLDSSLDLQERAPAGVQADLSIRGSTFGQTLILLNGLRLNDAQSAHHNLDIPVPLESIGQLEILRGSGSTQYGSDALGGVVNIVTRRPERAELLLRGGLGNFGSNEQGVEAAGSLRGISETLSASRDFSTGFRADRDYRIFSLSLDTMLRDPLGPASVLLALSDRAFGADQFYGNFDSWERTKSWFAGAHQNWGDRTEFDFAVRRHTDLFVLYRDRPSVYTNRHADETWEGAVRRNDPLPRGSELHYGAEIDADSIESNNLGNHSRSREAVYLAWDARVLKRFAFNLGVRDDLHDGWRNQVSPNASGAAWLAPWLKARAAASRAFRIPTYTDLYYQDPATLGSPNLKPETAWNYEAGLDWHSGAAWRGEIAVFERRDRNIIDYIQFAPGQLFQATNLENLNFTGVETSLQYSPTREQVFDIRYTGLRGDRSLAPGLVSRYVFNYPVHSGVVSWRGKLPGNVVARTRLGILERAKRSPYAVWDASFAYGRSHIRPYLQFTNLANTSYRDLPGVVEPGRTVRGGVELAWR